MTRRTTTPYNTRQRLFFSLLSVVVALFCLYVYFVSASVVHVVVRKEVDQEIAHIGNTVSELEARYIVAKRNVTIEDVSELGFVPESEPRVFVRKAPSSLVLLRNDEG